MNISDRTNYSAGARMFGRFMVHPDKILIRIFPIKSEVKMDSGIVLWVPPSAQKREAKGRWAKILQVGKRVRDMYPGMYNHGDIVVCHKYVDNIFGREGKFRLGGKLVAVTIPSEILVHIQFENDMEIPDFIKSDSKVYETV
jgi:co-chaperonin GroES (HSP10)